MSMKRLALSLAILGLLAGSGLLSQDYGAGRPEDIAAILPEEIAVFAEMVRPAKLLRDWKEYVGAFCTKEGKANVVQTLEAGAKEALTEIPEKLLKDLEQGFPSVHRIAVAMGKPRGQEDPFLAIVASASGEALWKTLVEDLKVFAAEEHPHRGSTILMIRKMGRHDLGQTLCVAAAGKRLVLSPYLASVKAVLDRASGQAPGRDLLRNESYSRLAAPQGEDPSVRAFAELHRFGLPQFFGMDRRGGSARVGVQQMDVADAALGLRKFRGLSTEATLHPGAVAAVTRLSIEPTCPLYEAWRQPAGPKDLLRYVPFDAQILTHLNLKGGTAVLADIEGLIRRYSEIESKASSEDANGPRRHHRGQDDEWKKSFERETGVSFDDLAASISTEAAWGVIGENSLGDDQTMMASMLFVLSLADVEKARGIVEKLTQKHAPYEVKKEGDVTYFSPGQEGHGPVFALQGKTALIAMKEETARKGIKAAADGAGISKSMPPEASGASKLLALRHSAIWSIVKMASRGKVPDASKDLDLSGISVFLFNEEKAELRISSRDAGVGLAFQSALMMMPVLLFASGPRMIMVDEDGARPEKSPGVPSAPKLPDDQLQAEVRKHLAALRSDEVVAREDSESGLRRLGPQAARLLADAVRKETDAEVKGRILKILTD
ncbi:MAG TPA: hypothetical protein VEN81_14615, partial [Planctomycetota bacterium]|nr:hypothetical protein [Planctomycetota bacterium]